MICLQRRYDCTFNCERECEILRDTRFNRPCPFYKKRVLQRARDWDFPGHNGIFRQIEGYDGKYFISEYGEVINKRGDTINRKRDRQGHPIVALKRPNDSWTTARVAVLVANAFIQGYGTVEHIDGDVDNCERFNLRRTN